jgi:hypothetical protein
MPDHTSNGRPGQRVTTRHVANYASDCSALEATVGMSDHRQRRRQRECKQDQPCAHVDLLQMPVFPKNTPARGKLRAFLE